MGILKASNDLRHNPTNFKILDCFPPGTKAQDLDVVAYNIAAKLVKEFNGDRTPDHYVPTPPAKEALVTVSPQLDQPLHLSNLKLWGSKFRFGDWDGDHRLRVAHYFNSAPADDDYAGSIICDVVISPS